MFRPLNSSLHGATYPNHTDYGWLNYTGYNDLQQRLQGLSYNYTDYIDYTGYIGYSDLLDFPSTIL